MKHYRFALTNYNYGDIASFTDIVSLSDFIRKHPNYCDIVRIYEYDDKEETQNIMDIRIDNGDF